MKTIGRRAVLVAFLALLWTGSALAQAFWYTNGAQVNPAGGQVMADTGALNVGTYQIRIVTSGTVMAVFDFEQRNAANNATLKSQQMRLLASGTQEVGILVIEVAQGERFRVTMVSGIVGTVQASIFQQ